MTTARRNDGGSHRHPRTPGKASTKKRSPHAATIGNDDEAPPQQQERFRLPFGEPVPCRQDRDGLTTSYVMTEEDLEEYAKAAPALREAEERRRAHPDTGADLEEEDEKKKKKEMFRELFGDSDEDEEYEETEAAPKSRYGDGGPPRDGETMTYVDPTTALMDSGNMEAMLPPTVATKTCPYPFRLRDYVCAWSPSGGFGRGVDPMWCWYDGHPVEGRPFRLPWFKDPRTGAYHVMGYFCGPGCARAFNACEFGRDRAGTVRRDALAVELAVTCYGYSPGGMPKAPNRLLLREYGGPLGIEEFRSYSVDGGGGCDPASRRITLEYPYVVVSQIVREHSGEKDSDYRRTFMQAAEPRGADGVGRLPPTSRSARSAAAARANAAADEWEEAKDREVGELDRYRISVWKQQKKREALAAPVGKRKYYERGRGGREDGYQAGPGRPKRRRTCDSAPAPPPPPTPPPQQQAQAPPPPPNTPQTAPPPPPRTPQTTPSPVARPPERDGYRSLRDLFHKR
jgi:hypothetical protein